MKRCQFCAEEIQDEAVVCKHCGRDLIGQPVPASAPVVAPKKNSAAMGCLGAVVLLFLVGWCESVIGPSTENAGPSSVAPTSPNNQTRTEPGTTTHSGQSVLCGQVVGKTPVDLSNATLFCSKGLVPGTVVGMMAMDGIAWIKVSREFADAFRSDRLSAEQVTKQWMQTWRGITKKQSVTLHIEWQDVEVALGDTTVFSGDQVTIR